MHLIKVYGIFCQLHFVIDISLFVSLQHSQEYLTTKLSSLEGNIQKVNNVCILHVPAYLSQFFVYFEHI